MPRTRQQVLKAKALRDVIAAVPFQCGFHPRRSVVVLSLRGPRKRVGQVTRADLPQADDLEAAAAELADFVVRDHGAASIVLVYDDDPWDAGQPPRLDLVDALLAELAQRDVPATDAIYVTQQRYWSYLCRGRRCCPPEGELLADARSSPVAAAYVLAGLAALPDREAVVARVHPSDRTLVSVVTDGVWRWLTAFAAAEDAGPDGRERVRPDSLLGGRTTAAYDALDAVLPTYLQRAGAVSDDRAAELIALFQDVGVRDEILVAVCRGPLPPGSAPGARAPASTRRWDRGARDLELEDAVERLLVDLAVRVEGPLAAAPLTMLAWHSWARGEGALARVAIDRARVEDPTYRLAVLLSSVLDHALAPDWVDEMRRADERAV